MSQPIPSDVRGLFQDKTFGQLATLMRDGTPHVTPVWIDEDGTHVLVNSARGRQKDKNILRNPQVAVAVSDPENPYHYVQVRGRVVETTEEGADAHIDKLAKRYLGLDEYPGRAPGEVRVIYKILPEHVNVWGR